MQITDVGKHNPRLRELRQALRGGTTTGDGWLPIEGHHLLEEAQRAGLEVGDVYIRDGVPNPPNLRHAFRVPAATFAHLSATREPQGLIALVRLPPWTLPEVLSRAGIITVLCGLQDPGNVGTIVRLADAFACAGCIAVEPAAGFHNSKLVRASAGSLFRVPHVRSPDLASLCTDFIDASIAVVGTAPEGTVPVQDHDWTRPTAVLFGNEGHGLSLDERRACDTILTIPCPGPVESLNTATSAAIVLYEATRHAGIRRP